MHTNLQPNLGQRFNNAFSYLLSFPPGQFLAPDVLGSIRKSHSQLSKSPDADQPIA
jgi:hypothetical protein